MEFDVINNWKYELITSVHNFSLKNLITSHLTIFFLYFYNVFNMNVTLTNKLKELGVHNVFEYEYPSLSGVTKDKLITTFVRGNVRMKLGRNLTEIEFLKRKNSIIKNSRLLKAAQKIK